MLNADAAAMTRAQLRYGPYERATIKPYSKTWRAVDGGALLKLYRGIEPEDRRCRELNAVRLAAHWGLSVPVILATGSDEFGSWTAFRMLPGVPCGLHTDSATREYVSHVLALTQRLHQPLIGSSPGTGWCAGRGDRDSQRRLLLDQLSVRCRGTSWWQTLAEHLEPLEAQPVVYLHGDLKPEHFLIDGDVHHVVDWEASARGPAVVDYADMMFHFVRDVVYEGVAPEHVPTDFITRLPFSAPVLAWRLLLWLDRRRPRDIALIDPHQVNDFAANDQPRVGLASLARALSCFRTAGVPR